MKNQVFNLTVAGQDLTFNVTTLAYNHYINELTLQNKIAPSVTFLNRTVDKACSEALKAILVAHPSASLQIAGKLVEQFAPDVEIEIKN